MSEQTHKIQYRVLQSRYRGRTTCPDCRGTRLRKDAQYVRIDGRSIADIVLLPISEALKFFQNMSLSEHDAKVAERLVTEITNRLGYLNRVGLGYLTLNRLSNTLSGGESQRISLATSLGSALVGSMYVLDEPSIGLHPKDAEQLIGVLRSLQQLGNTVVVVEHEEKMMEAADQIIDIGPEAGSGGGNLMFQGTMAELLQDTEHLHRPVPERPHGSGRAQSAPPLAQRPGADRRPRKQPQKREREAAAGRDDRGNRRIGLGQIHAHQAHSGPGPDEDAGRRRGRKHRQVRPPDRA